MTSSLPYIRKRWYELFLVIHITFAAGVLAGLYFHWDDLTERAAYQSFLWPAVAIWVFDRLLRIARLVYINTRPVILDGVTATATHSEGSELVRLEVTSFFPGNPQISPGNHYFLYEPTRWRGYESHPFTLCSWSQGEDAPNAPTSIVRAGDKELKELGSGRSSSADGNDVPTTDGTSPKTTKHTFLIRPQKGFTDRLYATISSSSSSSSPTFQHDQERQTTTIKIRMLLEGPYGTPPPTRLPHQSILLIAGGSGITSTISRIYSLLATSTPSRRLHLIWAVRSPATAEDVCAHELNGALANPNFHLTVYVTAGRGKDMAGLQKDGTISTTTTMAAAAAAAHGALTKGEVRKGRPDIPAVIQQESSNAGHGLAVFCCGPLSMEVSCRQGVRHVLDSTQGAALALYTEQFGW